MKQINILKLKRFYYHFTHNYLTLNNLVVVVAFVIALSWAWGSVGMMERNYQLQKDIDEKRREQQLTQLQVETLSYQQRYYQSDEYKELSVRDHLGLARSGEKVLILPPNSAVAKNADKGTGSSRTVAAARPSNFAQWMNFLFGHSQGRLRQDT